MTSSRISQIAALIKGPELVNTQKNVQQENNPVFGALLSQTAGGGKQNSSLWNGNMIQPSKVELEITNQEAFTKETSKTGWKEDSMIKNSNTDFQDKLPTDTEEKLTTFEEKVTEAVAEELGVTEEEVKEALEALGLTVFDLTDVSNLTNLVMELTGSEDVGELLLNGDFQQILKSIGELSQNLAEELNLTPEEMAQFLKQTSEMTESELPPQELQEAENVEPQLTESSSVESLTPEETKQAETTQVISPENQKIQNTNQQEAVEHPDNPKEAQQESTTSAAEAQEMEQEAPEQEEANEEFGKSLSETAQNTSSKSSEKTEHPQQQVTYQTTAQTVNQGQAVEVTQTVVQTRVNVEEIMRQVSHMTRVMVSQAESSIEMQLNPANLGKVYLQVVSREGVITAQLAAQNEAVKEALENQVAILKENMNQQGIKVEAIEVTIASHEFERNLEENQQNPAQEQQEADSQKSSRRNINLNHPDELEGIMSEEESLAAKIMTEQGNSVDLTA
ncbi:MAG: hypothetical protein HFH48_07150 [Lachnospiraceae bacterium]|nr:hypothetical protein [Lachnospiraceae bacterium]